MSLSKTQCIVLIVTSVLPGSMTFADDRIAAVIQTIAKNEHDIRNVRFNVSASVTPVEYDGKRWIVVDGKVDADHMYSRFGPYSTDILVDIESGRFHTTQHIIHEGETSDGSIVSSRDLFEFSFDGEYFMKFAGYNRITGEKPTRVDAPSDSVRHSFSVTEGFVDYEANQAAYIQDDLSFMEFTAQHNGLTWVTPFVYTVSHERKALKLSELLQERLDEGREVIVQETADGLLDIHFGQPYGFRVHYDPAAKRISKTFWGACVDCPVEDGLKFENMYYQRFAEYNYESETAIVPKTTILVETFARETELIAGLKSTGIVFEFTESKINDSLDDKDFQIEFPAGTTIRDYVKKQIYEAGDDAVDEAAAKERFLRFNRLLPEEMNYDQMANLVFWSVFVTTVVVLTTAFFLWIHRRHRSV